jgi:hypothetical protein
VGSALISAIAVGRDAAERCVRAEKFVRELKSGLLA